MLGRWPPAGRRSATASWVGKLAVPPACCGCLTATSSNQTEKQQHQQHQRWRYRRRMQQYSTTAGPPGKMCSRMKSELLQYASYRSSGSAITCSRQRQGQRRQAEADRAGKVGQDGASGPELLGHRRGLQQESAERILSCSKQMRFARAVLRCAVTICAALLGHAHPLCRAHPHPPPSPAPSPQPLAGSPESPPVPLPAPMLLCR